MSEVWVRKQKDVEGVVQKIGGRNIVEKGMYQIVLDTRIGEWLRLEGMSLSHPVQPTVQRKADFDVGSVFVVYSGGSGFIQISLGKLFCCFERCCELSFTKYLTAISLVAVCTRYPCIVYHHNNACSNFSATIY